MSSSGPAAASFHIAEVPPVRWSSRFRDGTSTASTTMDTSSETAKTDSKSTHMQNGTTTPLRGFPLFYYVILCPNVNVSTAMVYRKWDELHEGKSGEAHNDADIKKTIEMFKNLEEGFSLRNDLEAPADELYPEIKAFREILSSLDAKDVRMTGSGGAVFAVFKDEAKAQVLYEYLKTSPTFRVFMVKGIKGRHRLI